MSNPSANPLLSVVIPIYNEEKRLIDGFQTVYSYFKNKPYNFEIIFVDDGSIDKTATILHDIAANCSNVRVIDNGINKGKGAAVKNGVLSANGDIILFTDIDLSVPISYADTLVAKIQDGYDAVIGSRRVEGSKIEIHQPFIREFMGRGFTFISNIILGTNFSDHTCGMKAFKREAADNLFSRQILERWAFDSEILYLSKKLRYKVLEAPVVWKDAPGTKVSKFKDAFTSFAEILKIKFHHRGKIL